MNGRIRVAAAALLAAILLVTAIGVIAPALRNASSVRYLAFAFGERSHAATSLAQARNALESALLLRPNNSQARRLAAMDVLLARFTSDALAESPCNGAPPMGGFALDALESERIPQTYLATLKEMTPMDGDCAAQSVANLAWLGEDVRIFSDQPVFSLTSGARTMELAGRTHNRFETTTREGQGATVIAMENLAEADNVLTSARIPVTGGGTYMLGAWMRNERGLENGWLGIECRGGQGSSDTAYYYLARRFSDTTWQRIEDTIELEPGTTGCALVLLNYGEPETVYFDQLTFVEVPQD